MVARQGDGKAHLVSLNGSTVIVLKGLNREVSCMKTQTITNILLGIIAVCMLWEKLPSARNLTDRWGWRVNHTGARVFTDGTVGCQYIVAKEGGVAPRMDNNGKQICLDFDLVIKLNKESKEDSVLQEIIKEWERP